MITRSMKRYQLLISSLLVVVLVYFLLLNFFLTSKAATSDVILTPVADTFVAAGAPTINYGTRTSLEVDGSPIKIIYLKFNLQGVDLLSISSAKLRLKVIDSSASVQNVKSVANTSWSETTVNYNTRPAVGSTIGTISKGTSGTFAEVDITTAVKASSGQLISFGIDSTGSDGLDVKSRESSTEKPTLVITTSSSVTPTSVPPTATPSPSPLVTPIVTDTLTPSPTVEVTATPTPVSGNDPVIAAAGDIACGSGTSTTYPCKYKETSDVVLKINPTAVLGLGDLQYDSGSLSDFRNYYDPTWGRFKSITRPAIGNHEYGSNNGGGYFDYFNGVGVVNGPAGERGKGYYSFDIGTWHIIALNSNCTKVSCSVGSAQEQWLRADLAAHPSVCTLALWHHPLFSSGHDGDNTAITVPLKPLWQALYDAGAEIVLVGHSHHYERFAPQTVAGVRDDARGIREFVVGTGGRDFTGLSSTRKPNSEVGQKTTFGVLKLTLHPQSYDWEFAPIVGGTFTDSGSYSCH